MGRKRDIKTQDQKDEITRLSDQGWDFQTIAKTLNFRPDEVMLVVDKYKEEKVRLDSEQSKGELLETIEKENDQYTEIKPNQNNGFNPYITKVKADRPDADISDNHAGWSEERWDEYRRELQAKKRHKEKVIIDVTPKKTKTTKKKKLKKEKQEKKIPEKKGSPKEQSDKDIERFTFDEIEEQKRSLYLELKDIEHKIEKTPTLLNNRLKDLQKVKTSIDIDKNVEKEKLQDFINTYQQYYRDLGVDINLEKGKLDRIASDIVKYSEEMKIVEEQIASIKEEMQEQDIKKELRSLKNKRGRIISKLGMLAIQEQELKMKNKNL